MSTTIPMRPEDVKKIISVLRSLLFVWSPPVNEPGRIGALMTVIDARVFYVSLPRKNLEIMSPKWNTAILSSLD